MTVVLPTPIAAATPRDETAAPGSGLRTITVPAGVTTAHMGIIMAGNASGGTAALTATNWSALVANLTCGNETLTILKRLGGHTAGDVISINPGTQSVYNVSAFWFDTGGMDVDVIGTPAVRASLIATTTAPSITISQDEPVLIFSTERTTATGTTVTDPAGVTRLYYREGAGTPTVSMYAGVYDPGAAGATPAQTLTYNSASGNGAAVQVALLPQVTALAGTASISLTATGAPAAPAAGTALLSLTASGSAAGTSPATGTASLTLTATGNTGGFTAATGTATISLAANGGDQAAPAGSATIALTANGGATGTSPATGAASINLTAAGTDRASTGGTASIALTAQATTLVQTWLAAQPLYVAHRGGSADWPDEETLHAYTQSAAWNTGKLALEVSVWLSSDGVWVCSHDQTTGRIFSGTSYDITTTPWTTLQSLTSISGGYPIARLDDVLTQFATGNRVLFIDDKGQQSPSVLLNLLDTYGGAARFIAKGYITATTWADAATARGYQSWGYGYDADVTAGTMAAKQSHWSTLGMDVLSATASDWSTTKAFGKITLGHIIATAAQGNTAFATYGANGIVASGVREAVPNDASTGTASLSLTASGSPGPATTTGTASLSLTATASTSSPTAGTASFTLTANGNTNGSIAASGSASLALTASGADSARAAGTASITFTATGATSGFTAVTGTASVALTASGTSSARLPGTAVITITATASAPTAPAGGSAQLVLTATGTATGGVTPPPQPAADLELTAELAPQVRWLTVTLATQPARFAAELQEQP